MTTYRENELASVDTYFGVHIHHPQFLECVGAPESARLLGCPPAEWLQVMDRRDTPIDAVQLQRYCSVLGQEYFPSRAVDDAVPVPRVLRASTQMAAMGTRTGTARVVPDVIRGCPVSSKNQSNLYRFILNLNCSNVVYMFSDYPVGLIFKSTSFLRCLLKPIVSDIHIGISCWTIVVLETTWLRCDPDIVSIALYICCRHCVGRLFSYLILFGFARLTGGLYT